MKHFRPLLVSLLCAALSACHSPGQAQTAQTQATQSQSSPAAAPPVAISHTSPRPDRTDLTSGLTWMNVAALPTQGQQTYRLIQTGGPFPYSRDGVVFQNREGVLPSRSRGTYHEYTVKTPGSGDRGARRIICATPPVSTGPECYYTADHYASFQRIRP